MIILGVFSMPLFKYSCVTLMVLSISACATLATKPNEVEVAAQKLVGQPASNAFKIFGKPDHGLRSIIVW